MIDRDRGAARSQSHLILERVEHAPALRRRVAAQPPLEARCGISYWRKGRERARARKCLTKRLEHEHPIFPASGIEHEAGHARSRRSQLRDQPSLPGATRTPHYCHLDDAIAGGLPSVEQWSELRIAFDQRRVTTGERCRFAPGRTPARIAAGTARIGDASKRCSSPAMPRRCTRPRSTSSIW